MRAMLLPGVKADRYYGVGGIVSNRFMSLTESKKHELVGVYKVILIETGGLLLALLLFRQVLFLHFQHLGDQSRCDTLV